MAEKVLIAGASGLVGCAAINKFLADGWDVVAVSRRAPEVSSDRSFQHLAVNLQDEDACRDVFGQLFDVTHVVYAAVFEKPGLIAGWTERDQMDTNLEMLRNLMEPLTRAARNLQHVSFLQGTKAYGVHVHPMPIPARESAPRDQHENFYWLQEDYIRSKSQQEGFTFTIMRPQLVVGPNYGVVMNLPPVIGAYAAICREKGLPFSFPGGASFVWEAADVRLIADALAWAATSERAAGETFNVTNGEVFEWRNLWPVIAETLGVEAGPDDSVSMGTFFSDKSDLWDKIVAKYNLRPLSIDQLLGQSHYYADFCFAHGLDEGPRAFLSTVKLKQAGFTETINTEESFRYWLQDLIDRQVLPPAG